MNGPERKNINPEMTDVGDRIWLMNVTGWSHDKIARLCRQRIIKGSFQIRPGIRGSAWYFRKSKTLAWLRDLETNAEISTSLNWQPRSVYPLVIGWAHGDIPEFY